MKNGKSKLRTALQSDGDINSYSLKDHMMIVVMVRIRMRKFEFLITSTIILLYVSVKAMN